MTMKRLLVIMSIMALLVGCATKNTETSQEKQSNDSKIVKDIGTRGQKVVPQTLPTPK